MHGHAALAEREGQPAGADAEFEGGAAAGELGEQVDRRSDHGGVEHLGRRLVVVLGDASGEVVSGHVPAPCPTPRPEANAFRDRRGGLSTAVGWWRR